MSTGAASSREAFNSLEQLRYGREILAAEGNAVLSLIDRLGGDFLAAVELFYACRGSVIVTGMGKAGLVGQKLVATLASTGTRSHFLHPGEAMHGDLGRIHANDVVLALSQSGETEEIVRVLSPLAQMQTPIVAMTGNPHSALAQAATVLLDFGQLREACELGLAPSTSTTVMIALGDALALVTSRRRNFGPQDFARYHPGGSLGRKLSRVEDAMRPLAECRTAPASHTIRQMLIASGIHGRRSGAVMLTDEAGLLCGLFTDSDLARLFERRADDALDRPVRDVMTARPATVRLGVPLREAVELLSSRKISELPVIDPAGKPVGLIDITDVLALLPHEEQAAHQAARQSAANSTRSPQPADDVQESGRAIVPFSNHQSGTTRT